MTLLINTSPAPINSRATTISYLAMRAAMIATVAALFNPPIAVSAWAAEVISSQEAALFSSILERKLNDRPRKSALGFLVFDESMPADAAYAPYSAEALRMHLPEASDAVIADYLGQKRAATIVFPATTTRRGTAYKTISQSELNALTSNRKGVEYWEALQKAYPAFSGIMGFSRAGFDLEKNQALVLVQWMCHTMCGHGYIGLYEKKNNRWTTLREMRLYYL
jgi:hypothetical protein